MTLLLDCVKAFGFALAFAAVAVLALCVAATVGAWLGRSAFFLFGGRRKHNQAKCKWCREVE